MMALLEALLLMSAQAAATPPRKAEPPPLELIEFLGDWTQDEGKLIDGEKPGDRDSSRRGRQVETDRDARGTTP
ncbi:MAG: hypothetical protein RLZZ200_781 [Pseudomonadota bacterium]|jgi:hypothetical protein